MSLPISRLGRGETILEGAAAEAATNYFVVGHDDKGRWIVRDKLGLNAGVFCSFASALHFAKREACAARCGIILSEAEISFDLNI